MLFVSVNSSTFIRMLPTIFFFSILFNGFLDISPCESIAQAEITESATPGNIIKDLKSLLEAKGSKTDEFYLSDDSESFTLRGWQVVMTKSLDREELCSRSKRAQMDINTRCCGGKCCVYVKISSRKESIRSYYLKIRVIDVNDNVPAFQLEDYLLNVYENAKINTKFPLPTAEDPDEEMFGVQVYEVQNTNRTFDKYFRLKVDDGQERKQPFLILKQSIDREEIEKMSLVLVAKDGGNPAREGRIRINIQVLDENDNAPQFSEAIYKSSIREDVGPGEVVLRFKVADADSGDNGKVSLAFPPYVGREIQSHFQLVPERDGGVLRLLAKLDHEKRTLYKFEVEAKDKGQPARSSTAMVEITVINVNDARPVIMFYRLGQLVNQRLGRVYIDEGSNKETLIAEVKVYDDDNPEGTISCQLESFQEQFYLRSVTPDHLVEKKKVYELRSKVDLDREERSMYPISVDCVDSDGPDKLKETSKLELYVRDINDNRPIFRRALYYGTVRENYGNEVIRVSGDAIIATDRDDGENGTVRYSIASVSDNLITHFAIDRNTGLVKTIGTLDYEMVRKITVIITAADGGQPSLSSSVTLVVNVIDTNDNVPEVDASYYPFQIFENEPIGTLVGRVNVTDRDTLLGNKKVILKIKNNFASGEEADKMFTVDSDTGKIYTRVKLDREKTSHISFNIVVFNANPMELGNEKETYGQRYSVDVPVAVTVLDRNDNRPVMVLRDKPTEKAINPEVIFYTQTSQAEKGFDNCVTFPYMFVDPDEADKNGVKVSLKGTKQFRLNIEVGTICIEGDPPDKGQYKAVIVAEDGDGNNTKKEEFLINIFVKDDPTSFSLDRQKLAGDSSNAKGNTDGISNGNYSYFRSNILYVIIGSIAAALLSLLIVVLVGFRKFIMEGRNIECKPIARMTAPNVVECQDLFEYGQDHKYKEALLSQNKKMQCNLYRSDIDLKSVEANVNQKFLSNEQLLPDFHMGPNPVAGNVNYLQNYQTLSNQVLTESGRIYHSLSNPKSDIFIHKQGTLADICQPSEMSPFPGHGGSSAACITTMKFNNNNKASFQSTFV